MSEVISAAVIGATVGAVLAFVLQKVILHGQTKFQIDMANKFARGSDDIVRTQIFMELRKSYLEVLSRLDARYHDEDWDPRNEEQKYQNPLKDYWYQTFNEWYVTNILNEGKYKSLWTDFYAKAVIGGLRNKPIRIIGCDLFNGASTFSGYKQQFKTEIKRIYHEENSVDFFGDTGISEKNTA